VRKILALPIPPQNIHKFPHHIAEFSGRYSTYEKCGFKPEGVKQDFYQLMSLELVEKK
jgi:hypothetical protein